MNPFSAREESLYFCKLLRNWMNAEHCFDLSLLNPKYEKLIPIPEKRCKRLHCLNSELLTTISCRMIWHPPLTRVQKIAEAFFLPRSHVHFTALTAGLTFRSRSLSLSLHSTSFWSRDHQPALNSKAGLPARERDWKIKPAPPPPPAFLSCVAENLGASSGQRKFSELSISLPLCLRQSRGSRGGREPWWSPRATLGCCWTAPSLATCSVVLAKRHVTAGDVTPCPPPPTALESPDMRNDHKLENNKLVQVL